jgi:hypothetical protein
MAKRTHTGGLQLAEEISELSSTVEENAVPLHV